MNRKEDVRGQSHCTIGLESLKNTLIISEFKKKKTFLCIIKHTCTYYTTTHK